MCRHAGRAIMPETNMQTRPSNVLSCPQQRALGQFPLSVPHFPTSPLAQSPTSVSFFSTSFSMSASSTPSSGQCFRDPPSIYLHPPALFERFNLFLFLFHQSTITIWLLDCLAWRPQHRKSCIPDHCAQVSWIVAVKHVGSTKKEYWYPAIIPDVETCETTEATHHVWVGV